MLELTDKELEIKRIAKAFAETNFEARGGVVPRRVTVKDFIPQQPTHRQKLFLDLDNEKEVFYGGAAGGGKLLRLDEPIPTPDGWLDMGSLEVGDVIFADTGEQCEVEEVYAIVVPERNYRITFDDGSSIESGADHQWITFDAKELAALTRRDPEWQARRRANRPSRATGRRSAKFTEQITQRNQLCPPTSLALPLGTVRTTQEIVDSLFTPSGRTNHAIRLTGALKTPWFWLPIDPYLLGAWLGDGHSSSGSFTTADPEIVVSFGQSYEVTNRTAKYAYGTRGMATSLRRLGVLNDKHIPAWYLRASRSQRLSLLQGLMDTDGTATQAGSVEFTNTNKALIDGVYELITSLGWKCRVMESRATLYGKDCGPKWDIKWTPSEYVFRLERKRERQKLATRRTIQFRYIVACDLVKSVPMRCIRVNSPSHCYLAGRQMVPTHNSSALLMDALRYVTIPNYSALLLRRTYADLSKQGALMDRAKEWLTGTGAAWNEQRKMWTFPSGARLAFGYLETENDKFQYQGAEYQYIGFDELSQFTKTQYTYLFSRLRRLKDSNIPVRMRSGSNPGGIGSQWVNERFIPEGFTPDDAIAEKVWTKSDADEETGEPITRYFVPARLDDNPYLDQAEYELSLRELDPVTRAQLRRGDWQITTRGDILYMWSEPHVIITWSQFEKVFGSRHIPLHWRLGVFQDWGTTTGHPCVTKWFATAAENSPVVNGIKLAGSVFCYRSMLETQVTAVEMKEKIYKAMQPFNEMPRTQMWEMSHEASSERLEYRRSTPQTPYVLPFVNWDTGRTRGIEQLKSAITVRDDDKPHPFKDGLYGRPLLYFIVDDAEYQNPQTEAGMLRVRQEAPAYKWAVPKSGEVAATLVPYALFNDAIDVVKGAAARYFPRSTKKNREERIIEAMPDAYKPESMAQMTGYEREKAHYGYISERAKIESKFKQADNRHNKNVMSQLEWK